MNNSFPRLIDGMCATLRSEVLSRVDDDYARGQIYGVINLLNTFKVRADWSAGFLAQQIEAQRAALAVAEKMLSESGAGVHAPTVKALSAPAPTLIANLLAERDEGNRAIGQLMAWLDEHRATLAGPQAERMESALRDAMRAEVEIELKNSPRPLFAEMSGSGEG
jgi:hypothetical protein